ncbi:pyridoxamine 5'-phosphate oxidase family protein [Qingshengfaniella alkalisoli]|uniref:Pyridoxamine 5'-phosphate oxidase family protein n=1 Tax=Qingshengfaniella alkalisoli TaxID=2599296 RepID=A0A5B8I7T6_9RHOB|nr:pyridoxamine 5'-phosphate oxidase family protein [Qingshengfaniella alkalisoli]QDY68596.1 pyridoxamine 5'-phosphate oxidase family protein [Qingshengfaniella alkalisoli]
MEFIDGIADLEALYGVPQETSTAKVAAQLTPEYRRWIEASRFCVLTTVGPEGTDASPRGDDNPVVRIQDGKTLLLPDWRGNNRIDSLRNIVRDPRVSLMFMVPGSNNVIRVNGRAKLTADEALIDSFARRAGRPRTVAVIEIGEVYFQCARAIVRSRLWGDHAHHDLPSPGDMLAALTDGRVGGESYDREWPERAANSMW